VTEAAAPAAESAPKVEIQPVAANETNDAATPLKLDEVRTDADVAPTAPADELLLDVAIARPIRPAIRLDPPAPVE
ncbi:hypothetical protein OFC55_43740, partial [Escherichia coli]|nr:hypothetical protein [Escherichia coli]